MARKVSADDLNNTFMIAVLEADQVISSSVLLVNSGLALELPGGEEYSYALDGYIAYATGATPDILFAMSGPSRASGHWGLWALTAATTGGSGNIGALRFGPSGVEVFSDDSTLTAGGSDTGGGELCAMLHGQVNSRASGVLRVRFSQATSNASDTVLKAGSWLRATRLTP